MRRNRRTGAGARRINTGDRTGEDEDEDDEDEEAEGICRDFRSTVMAAGARGKGRPKMVRWVKATRHIVCKSRPRVVLPPPPLLEEADDDDEDDDEAEEEDDDEDLDPVFGAFPPSALSRALSSSERRQESIAPTAKQRTVSPQGPPDPPPPDDDDDDGRFEEKEAEEEPEAVEEGEAAVVRRCGHWCCAMSSMNPLSTISVSTTKRPSILSATPSYKRPVSQTNHGPWGGGGREREGGGDVVCGVCMFVCIGVSVVRKAS